MKHSSRKGIVRYLPYRARKRGRIQVRYTSKAYRLLERQLEWIRLGQTFVANPAVRIVSGRAGVTRKPVAEHMERAAQLNLAEFKAKADSENAAYAEKCLAAYRQFFVPYHRNKLHYPLVPDEVMELLGFGKCRRADAVQLGLKG